jgi:hypothetical protein
MSQHWVINLDTIYAIEGGATRPLADRREATGDELRVMAAAPDLLEALKAAADSMPGNSLWAKCMTAICKAEGTEMP